MPAFILAVFALLLLLSPAAATAAGGPVVAVVDSGVDLRHPALRGVLWTNAGEIARNRIDDDGNGIVDDVHGADFAAGDGHPGDPRGHGTHVAGLIARRDGGGRFGRATGARIMALRVIGRNGYGTSPALAGAIDYATRMGARVINLSIAYFGDDPALREALERAAAAGVLVVAAAGNGGENLDREPVYPGSYRLHNMLVVGAVNRHGRLASWSARGAGTVDLLAPGVDIRSTLPGRRWGRRSGTSQAAALVTRVAALLLAAHPEHSAAEVRTELVGATRPIESVIGGVLTTLFPRE